jgi:iron complex transport system substrate-binding protein
MTTPRDASWWPSDFGPQRIVCLTEETTEWLYLLGQERRIVGISGYTVRPPRARQEKLVWGEQHA